jgi:hypothetical protein
MWVTQEGELAGLPTPEGHGLNLATGIAGVLAGRGSSNTAITSGSKVAVIPVQGTIQKRGGYCSLAPKTWSHSWRPPTVTPKFPPSYSTSTRPAGRSMVPRNSPPPCAPPISRW